MLSPCPDESALPMIYPPNYYAYDFTGKQTLGYRVKGLLDRRTAGQYMKLAAAGSKILDVGCGDGRLLRLLAARGVPRDRLFGMELDKRAVDSARQHGMAVSLGRFEDVDYPPASFGLVIMQQVIEHVLDPRDVLERSHEVLAPGGAIVLETPNVGSWDHWLFSRRYWGGYHIPRHLYLFDPKSMSRLLEATGFRVAGIESLASPSFWIQSLHHALAEHGAPPALVQFFDSHFPNPLALACFTSLDGLGKLLGITSNMRIIGIKQ
jgi:2-polyprenyl-3-methyl-5-hydroxy-6-metoxy-1,4-benzoquinol methylase